MLLTDKNFGVVILCPGYAIGGLRQTVSCLNNSFPETPRILMVGEDSHTSDVLELRKYGKICYGGKTITSLIDTGIEVTDREWVFVIMAGARVRYCTLKKYIYFNKSEKDVFYPVMDKKWEFDEASTSGLMLNKKFAKEVGKFGFGKDMREVKLLWAERALNKDVKFKALVGVPLL